ncbi:MAG: cache domain-containing protein [Proteobacteria bacterium]|nr:cache domain-containing protein [Pseudomonadota bacterium]
MNNVKTRLLPIISVLLILGFLLTSLASYFVSRASLRSEISENELPLTSDNIYSEIQRDLMRPVFISSFMANDTFLRNWILDGEKQEQQIIQYLKEIQEKYLTFTSFLVSEKSRIYYHSGGILKKVMPEEERDRWYFRVREMKDEYEINVDPDSANKDAMTIFINYRVLDYDGELIGVTGVGLAVKAVKKIIEVYQKKYRRTIYFLDRNGSVKVAGAEWENPVEEIAQMKSAQEIKKGLANQLESSFSSTKNGQVIHTNIRYIKEFDWYLVVEQSEQETIRRVFTTLVFNLAICIVVTIVVVLLVHISVTAYRKRIETLRGIIPICSYCKEIRDDKGYWNQVEAYVAKYTDAQFSHSVCPKCMKTHYPEYCSEDQKGKCG